ADAGKAGDVLLTQAAHAAHFPKFEHEIHGNPFLSLSSSAPPITPQFVEPTAVLFGSFSPVCCRCRPREKPSEGMIASSDSVDIG
ncbi:MAG TPA: hypothetical protein VMU84_18060, partial [Thermoanaerobaculia bacterium]|nr:hypothetical protein [Thermoanaerobaculia bacterium]